MSSPDWAGRVLIPVFALTFVGLATAFARLEAIWVDEVTQLTGLGLGWGELIPFLLHELDRAFLVPIDRMPPLSYVIGKAWSEVFGLGEFTMRIAGIAAVAAAFPALALTGHRLAGRPGALFAVAAMVSPVVIAQAIEIRAYPFFLSLSCWAAFLYVRTALDGPRPRRLVGLTLLLAAACYTHFFGVVLSASLLASLLLLQSGSRRGLLQIAGAGIAGLALILPLAPFVLAAAGVTQPVDPAAGPGPLQALVGAVEVGIRLLAHQIFLAFPVLMAVVGLSTAVLLAIFLGQAQTFPRSHLALALPVAFGLLAIWAVSLAVPSISAQAIHYNVWLIPFIVAALSVALSGGPRPRLKALARTAGVLFVAAQLAASVNLVRAGTLYTHGPGEWIAAQITDPEATLVLHDADGDWAFAYFPVAYRFGGAVEQWVVDDGGAPLRVTAERLVPIGDPDMARARFDTVLAVETRATSAAELAGIRQGRLDCDTLFGPTGPSGAASRCAFHSARIARLGD